MFLTARPSSVTLLTLAFALQCSNIICGNKANYTYLLSYADGQKSFPAKLSSPRANQGSSTDARTRPRRWTIPRRFSLFRIRVSEIQFYTSNRICKHRLV